MRRVVTALISIVALFTVSCGGEGGEPTPEAASLPTPSVGEAPPEDAPDRADGAEAPDDESAPVEEPGASDQAKAAPGSDTDRGSKTSGGATSKSLVLAALDKSTTGQDSFRVSMAMIIGGVPELGGGEAAITFDVAVADGGQSSQVSMDMSSLVQAALSAPDVDPAEAALLEAAFAEPIEVRVVGDTTYASASMLSFLVPVDTTWIAFETDASMGDLGMEEPIADPAALLALLHGIDDDAETVGTESIDGVSTTHVHGSLSVAEAIAAASASDAQAIEEAVGGFDMSDLVDVSLDVFDIDIWIDDEGLVRRMILAVDDLAAFDQTGATPEGAYFQLVLELTDYGADIEVPTPDPADVTVIDESIFGVG